MSLAQQVIDELQYSESPNFLRPGAKDSFEEAADFSHIFRRANEHCRLRGVYSLRETARHGRDSVIPIVYVCEATSDDDAQRIHRLVWNQNVVPFLIVTSPKEIRLYSGFRYEVPQADSDSVKAGILGAASDLNKALKFLELFRAARINDGTIWERWGEQVTPATRVDWKLLSSLNNLDTWLRNNGIGDSAISHALIGKYVYLQYLRHRDILSDRKLAKWGLKPEQIFGRTAQATAFWKVVDELDAWLNGSVFPLRTSEANRPSANHIRKVAGTLAGDDPLRGQFSLGFDDYDFSFIPIETLSVIYEQFLHAPDPEQGASKGKSQGAYYTPITLVNFMLEELDALHPFKNDMRVLDPACGSGAFLVQCYRRIIERDEEFEPGKPMRPARLRDLLEQHIFGIDRDQDACRVAELSLSLTLLDYVSPPDLERTPKFRLPELHGRNIFHGDFFDPKAEWRKVVSTESFDWIVGNPPWIELKSSRVSEVDQHVWRWLQDNDNQKERPTGGNQVAEAFAWEVIRFAKPNGTIALLLPAMTLFKNESRSFRQRFFSIAQVVAVANFANLRRVLFPGHRYRSGRRTTAKRPVRPAAAIFYSQACQRPSEQGISVFSPFVVDQVANRPTMARSRQDTWNITIDASQIRTLPISRIEDGNALIWKTAMWGSHLDIRLISSLQKRFPSFNEFADAHRLAVAEGFQLRSQADNEATEAIPELIGRTLLKMASLRNCGRIFEFPEVALDQIEADRANLRIRGGRSGLEVSHPPHVIVDGARRFAVYSDEFIAIPPRQIGIRGDTTQVNLLKALSLYLASDFARYYQFLWTPEWGISTPLSTLNSLKTLPIPLDAIETSGLDEWAALHERMVIAARNSVESGLFRDDSHRDTMDDLLRNLNETVSNLLGLRDDERILVYDLVHLRMQLFEGATPERVIGPPSTNELTEYGVILRNELNDFVSDQPELNHTVTILPNGQSAMMAVTLQQHPSLGESVNVLKADPNAATQFSGIRARSDSLNSQWIYFRRNLRMYEGNTTYVFKPLQRLHWTKSQALLDAGAIIAETLS